MVDLGVIGNYINLGFIKKLGLLGKVKAVPKPITGLNGENLETLFHKPWSTMGMVDLGYSFSLAGGAPHEGMVD
jgi:hypothetical protein